MPPSKQDKLIEEIYTTVTELKTVMLGKEGTDDKGLLGEVHKLSNSHYKLRTRFWILVAFLTGSGVLGGGIWWLNGG